MKQALMFIALAVGVAACSKNAADETEPVPETPAAPPAPEPPALDMPTLEVVKTNIAPRIDGSLGDEAWKHAKTTRRFINTLDGTRGAVSATFRALWDDRYLYVAANVDDELLRATHTERDARLWEQDCVELMLDPDGDGKGYVEIQVSPRGVVFDTKYDTRRRPQPYGHVDWDSGARAAASRRGQLNDAEKDAGYTVELALPWSALGATPKSGDTWRANVYLMDLRTDRQVASGWSAPLVSDFHVPARFGRFRFSDTAKAAPAPRPIQMSSDRAEKMRAGGRETRIDVKERMLRQKAIDRRQPGEPLPEMPDTPPAQ